MNLRIQTYGETLLATPNRTLFSVYLGADVYDVLQKGLDDLMAVCDVVMDKFTIARNEFQSD